MTGEEPFQSFAMCWNMSLGIACTGVSLMEKGLFPSIVSVFLSSGFWIKTISVLTYYPCPIRCQDPASRQSCTLKTVVKNRKATIPWGKKASVSEKYTLSDKLWKYLQNYADKHKKAGNGFGFGLCDHDSVARTLSARYYKDGSEILVSQGCDKNPRRLTPRECARLMGFDRPGQSDFKIPVSDTQAYRQSGNAVLLPVVEAIASHILPHLQN